MRTKVIIHPDEFNKKWVDRAVEHGISVVGLHSVGNCEAHVNLANDIKLFESKAFRQTVDYAKNLGVEIEYEVHAVSYLLPRDLFLTNPEYFRADENSQRTSNSNFCASNSDAIEIIANNALALTQKLYGSSNNYFFWTDDIKGAYCKCEKCKHLSASDQNLILMNAIVKKLKSKIPNAKVAFLAYYDTVELPTKVKPENGVFLEYAPYERDLFKPASCVSENQIEKVKKLLDFFGKNNSCVLEYWFDNSYFSGYKKPPKKLLVDSESIKKDVEFYRLLGFENISSFACFLGDDYTKLFGEPDISAFKNIK